MKNILIISIIVIGGFLALSYGLDKHDRNECQYWASIKDDSRFFPTYPMVAQCEHFHINIK